MSLVGKFKTLQEFFADESRWTKGYYFRDENGSPCSLEEATCACLAGARRIVYGDNTKEEDTIKDLLYDSLGIIGNWNDASERTIEDVRKLVRELNI